MSIYALKPKFQDLLRPLVRRGVALGITANQVTLFACVVSVLLGWGLCAQVEQRIYFLLLPFWMLLRMALNAMDGMLAREFGQKSALGAYLNELTDVVSDAALYLPFAWVTPFNGWQIGLFIFMAVLSEYAGVLGLMVGASRRYDGPLGKSDRAFVFGLLGLLLGCGVSLPSWSAGLLWVLIGFIGLTILRRVQAGLAECRN